MIPSSTSAKLVQDIRRRGTRAQEFGLKTGKSSGDQSPILDDIIETQCMVASGGYDNGPLYLPPGIIRFDTTAELFNIRGLRIEGAGYAVNDSVRSNNGSTDMATTEIYWGGDDEGGPVIAMQSTHYNILQFFSVYLNEDNSGTKPQAEVGIHWANLGGGMGRNTCRHVAIAKCGSATPAGIGNQFGGDGSNATNVDTFYFERCSFQNLDVCNLYKHLQSIEHSFMTCNINRCNTVFHFELGGVCYAHNVQWQDDRDDATLTLFKVDDSGSGTGSFAVFGGKCDRQGSATTFTLFDCAADCTTSKFSAYDFDIKAMASGAVYDGTSPGYIEASGNNVYHLENCKLFSQPVVRWRDALVPASDTAPDKSRVTVRGGWVNDRKFGTELVTATGGYAGEVVFQGVMRSVDGKGTPEDVTVGVLPVHGSPATHWDIDDFDASEGGSWSESWLGGGQDDSPSWSSMLRAYYRFDEALGATSIIDQVNFIDSEANDLTIESDAQVEGCPIPYLERWCDFTQHGDTVTTGIDTGVEIDPDEEDFAIFGIAEITEYVSGRMIARIDGGYRFFFHQAENPTSGRITLSHGDSSTESVRHVPPGSQFAFVVTGGKTANTVETYISGCLQRDVAPGYATSTAGNLYVGGSTASPFPGKLSRFGVIVGSTDSGAHLSAKEATILCNAMTVVAKRATFY